MCLTDMLMGFPVPKHPGSA